MFAKSYNCSTGILKTFGLISREKVVARLPSTFMLTASMMDVPWLHSGPVVPLWVQSVLASLSVLSALGPAEEIVLHTET